MCNQPNDYLLESLWSLKKVIARLWSPEPRLASLSSTAENLFSSSAPPTLRTPSSAKLAVDAGPTVASEVPNNPAAHHVTISCEQVKQYTEETEDCSQRGPHSPKMLFIVAYKFYIVTPSVYPSNLPIGSGLASADDALKRQFANIATTNADISITVPLDAKISSAFSIVDDAEMAIAGMISLIFLLMKFISILI